MNSERYHAQFEQLPPEFTIAELIQRYRDDLSLTNRDRRDVARFLVDIRHNGDMLTMAGSNQAHRSDATAP